MQRQLLAHGSHALPLHQNQLQTGEVALSSVPQSCKSWVFCLHPHEVVFGWTPLFLFFPLPFLAVAPRYNEAAALSFAVAAFWMQTVCCRWAVAFTCTKLILKTRMQPRGSAPVAKENRGSAAPGCHLSILSQEGARHGDGEISFSIAIFPGLPGSASLLRGLGGDACGIGARSAVPVR